MRAGTTTRERRAGISLLRVLLLPGNRQVLDADRMRVQRGIADTRSTRFAITVYARKAACNCDYPESLR